MKSQFKVGLGATNKDQGQSNTPARTNRLTETICRVRADKEQTWNKTQLKVIKMIRRPLNKSLERAIYQSEIESNPEDPLLNTETKRLMPNIKTETREYWRINV